MSQASLDQLLDMAERFARTVLIDNHEPELTPVFHVVMADGSHGLCPGLWGDDKPGFLKALEVWMKENGVVSYCMIAEAWTATQPKGWKPGDPEGPAPSERPDRKEVVAALAADKHEAKTRTWDIVRGEAGTIVKLARTETQLEAASGRMASLLK